MIRRDCVGWAVSSGRHTANAQWICAVRFFGMSDFIKTSSLLSLDAIWIFNLSIKNCLTLNKYFSFSILCHQLHSSPNHSKLSFCFPELTEIQILFFFPPKLYTQTFFLSWFFSLLNHFCWPRIFYQIGQSFLMWGLPEQSEFNLLGAQKLRTCVSFLISAFAGTYQVCSLLHANRKVSSISSHHGRCSVQILESFFLPSLP